MAVAAGLQINFCLVAPGCTQFRRKNAVMSVRATSIPAESFMTSCDRPAGSNYLSSDLLYMPYMRQQWNALSQYQTLEDLPLKKEFGWQESSKIGGGRVENWLMKTERLRRIRMTYFDSGRGVQAFNSLCYPELGFSLPLLGIDLLAFGKSKILCVIDFQPIIDNPVLTEKYTAALKPIRDAHLDLCYTMTDKHFDITQFFSPQMILFRSDLGHEDPALKVPEGRLFTVYKAYLKAYMELLVAAEPDWTDSSCELVRKGQQAYERYSEERDPAIRLFDASFGREWSKNFTEDFLFPESKVFS